MWSFGSALREARQAQHMTQEDLARAAGVSLSNVRNWERRDIEPRAGAVRRIALALGVSADFLLGLSDRLS